MFFYLSKILILFNLHTTFQLERMKLFHFWHLTIISIRWLTIIFNKKPFPSPGDLPHPGTEPRSPALQADSLPSEPLGKPQLVLIHFLRQFQKEHHISYYFIEEKLKYFSTLNTSKDLKVFSHAVGFHQRSMWFSLGRDRKVWFKPSDIPSMIKKPFLLNLFYFLWFRIPPLRTKCFEYMILSPQHSITGGIIIHLLLISRLYITWPKFTSNTFIFFNFFSVYHLGSIHSFIPHIYTEYVHILGMGIW